MLAIFRLLRQDLQRLMIDLDRAVILRCQVKTSYRNRFPMRQTKRATLWNTERDLKSIDIRTRGAPIKRLLKFTQPLMLKHLTLHRYHRRIHFKAIPQQCILRLLAMTSWYVHEHNAVPAAREYHFSRSKFPNHNSEYLPSFLYKKKTRKKSIQTLNPPKIKQKKHSFM